MRRTGFAAALSCIAAMSIAGTNTWTPMGPSGGSIHRIAFSSAANTAFALSAGGLYRSTDGGASWRPVSLNVNNGPQGIAIDPVDPQRVYVAVPDTPSFFQSTDGGATFQPIAGLPASYQAWQAAAGYDGATVYLASGARVFRSTNRGQGWTTLPDLSSDPTALIGRLVVDPSNSSTLYAALRGSSQQSLLKSTDGGQTWQTLYTDSNTPTDLAVTPAAPAQLWAARGNSIVKSTDRGATWTTVLTDLGFTSVAVDPGNASVVYAGTAYGTIFRSSNGGSSWTPVTGTHFAGQNVTLAIDPASSSRVLLGGTGGLYATNDSGASWLAQQTGIFAARVDQLSVDTSSDRIYVNASSDGVYYLTPGASAALPVDNLELRQLQSGNPSQPAQSIYITSMTAQSGRLLASLSNGLARSVDGGNSWTQQAIVPGSGTQQIFNLASAPASPQPILAAARSYMLRSTNGGASWSTVGSGLPAGSELSNLRVAPSDGQRAYVAAYRSAIGSVEILGIWRTLDGGLNWAAAGNSANAPAAVLAIDPASPDTIYGARDSALYRSTDGGSTWSVVSLPPIGNAAIMAVAIDPLYPKTIYVVGDAVVRTLDGGTTWDVLRAPGTKPWLVSTVALVDPNRPGTLLLGTSSYGVQAFTTAPDLQLTGTAPTGSPALGVPFGYDLRLLNQGPFGTRDVVVHLQWPASASNVTVAGPGATCTVGSGSAYCTYQLLRNGDSASITVTMSSSNPGAFQLNASVESALPDAVATNNSVALMTTLAARADLSVALTGPASAQVGDAVTYTITARNPGPNAAASPTLTLQLPSGLAAGTVTTSVGSCSTGATALVTCMPGDLAANSAVTVNVAATASSSGLQNLSAQVSSVTADGSAADNTATLATTVAAAPAPSTPGGNGGSGGGGGGGDVSLLDVLGLCLLVMVSVAARSRRHQSLLSR